MEQILIVAGALLVGGVGGWLFRRLSDFDKLERENAELRKPIAYRSRSASAARQVGRLHLSCIIDNLSYIIEHAEPILTEARAAIKEAKDAIDVIDRDQRGEYDPDKK